MTQRQNIHNIMNFGISALLFGFSIAVIIYGIIPGFTVVNNYYSEIKQITEENNKIRKKVNLLSGLDQNILTDQMQILLSAVPENKSIETSISTIQNVAANTGITINSLQIENPGDISSTSAGINKTDQEKLGSNTVTVTLSVLGNMDQTNAFLTQISMVRRLMRIINIESSFKGNSSADVLVSTQIDIDAFYASLPKTLGKADDSISPLSENELAVISKVSAYPLVSFSSSGNTSGEIIRSDRANPFSP
jgi:hypothetical protein